MFANLLPLLSRLPDPTPYTSNRTQTLKSFQSIEWTLQHAQPTLPYNQLLTLAYTTFAASLNLPTPSDAEAQAFGAKIGDWPALPDTVAALKVLKKHYRLVFLSNVDNASIRRTITGPLEGADIDAV